MAKYSTITLKIRGSRLLGLEELSLNEKKALDHGPVIYIYRGTVSKKVYIGQTIHFLARHSQHYSGKEEKFNTAAFNRVLVVSSRLFNGSSLDDVESQLITYFNADNPKAHVGYDDEVINRTGGNTIIEYRGREAVSTDVVLPLWEDVLFPECIKPKYVLAHLLCALFESCHLFLVTKNSDDIIASYNSQFGIQSANHLQVLISYSIEHHRVDVL